MTTPYTRHLSSRAKQQTEKLKNADGGQLTPMGTDTPLTLADCTCPANAPTARPSKLS